MTKKLIIQIKNGHLSLAICFKKNVHNLILGIYTSIPLSISILFTSSMLISTALLIKSKPAPFLKKFIKKMQT